MNNKNKFIHLPRLKTEPNFYDQKSILKRNHLPTNLCESLARNKIQKFRKIFLSISKKRQKEKKNYRNSINTISTDKSSNLNTNIKIIEENMNKKNSLINTETELKINKLMDIFNTDKKLQKNAAYDLIKGRMFSKLNNYLVLNEQNYNALLENNDDYSTTKKQKEFLFKKKYELYSKKKLNIITESTPKLFNTERITRRFEDLHMTPEEFLNANFTKEEIEIMIKNVNYFKLNKEPLKEWDLNINLTLKDTLNKEEEEQLAQELKEKNIKKKEKQNKRILKLVFDNDDDDEDNEKKKKITINENKTISDKNLKIGKYENIPKLDLKKINNLNNYMLTEESIKRLKKFKFCINPKNKLLYMVPSTTCSRYKKHIKMNNLTERSQNSKDYYSKTFYKIGSNTKHIERFENKKNQKIELVEAQHILNEIKSNYMKKNHEKITQDNIKKNKVILNNELKSTRRERLNSNPRYISLNNNRILLSERLWK